MIYGPFFKLNVALNRKGVKHSTAAKAIGVTDATFQRRLNGTYPWTLKDMYILSDLLDISTDQWGEMFPNAYKED